MAGLPGGSPSEWLGYSIEQNGQNVGGGTFAPIGGDSVTVPNLGNPPTNPYAGSFQSSQALLAGVNQSLQTYANGLEGGQAPSVTTGATAGAPVTATPGTVSAPSGQGNVLVRVGVIVLGFIFVAVGLMMFRPHAESLVSKVTGRG